MIFSHRPKMGITVGAHSQDGKLFVSTSLVNDGTSRNGRFHNDRRDEFSRAIGRNIVTGRLNALVADPTQENDFSIVFDTEMTDREFISRFRKVFKPTPNELDNVFGTLQDFGGVEIISRPWAQEIVDIALNIAKGVVANASASR